MTIEVVEYTDPWCSWAWGTEPKLRRLRWRYDDRFQWRTVMGDLVADRRVDRPDFDARRAGATTAEYWHKVHLHTGQPWPVHLQWAPTLSAHAARAVKAAADAFPTWSRTGSSRAWTASRPDRRRA